MEFHILGPLEVTDEGEALPLGGAKQRALLALLLLRPNEPVSVDRIVDELWGERPPTTAPKNVQVYVSHLRKVLGESTIATTPAGYALHVAEGSVDAQRAEEALALAQGKAAAERAELLRAALALWRGLRSASSPTCRLPGRRSSGSRSCGSICSSGGSKPSSSSVATRRSSLSSRSSSPRIRSTSACARS